jgi:hypothetical protein
VGDSAGVDSSVIIIVDVFNTPRVTRHSGDGSNGSNDADPSPSDPPSDPLLTPS